MAVLIDEYDKPILDALEVPEVARANRDFLRGIYSVIKDCDAHVKFTFLTGVSKSPKVSLFSGLNNLQDITLDPRYSAICGYTEQDLDEVFAPELPAWTATKCAAGTTATAGGAKRRCTTPSTSCCCSTSREFKAHWFETGSPKFLIDTLLRRGVPTPDLEGMVGTEALLSAFDVDVMSVEALLFQTGYLTIVDEEDRGGRIRYRLGYPNQEVRQSLNERLLAALLRTPPGGGADDAPLRELLAANDFAGLEAFLRSLFAGVPHQWHVNNNIQDYEGYYASVGVLLLCGAGLGLGCGGQLQHGPCGHGGALLTAGFTFSSSSRWRGVQGGRWPKSRRGATPNKYRRLGRPVHLIGVEFSREDRNIAAFEVARAA